jgi:putative membrane protein
MRTTLLSLSVLAIALGLGTAQAQTTPGAAGTAGTGSSVTGGQAAPAAQPGTGTRNVPTKKDDKVARGDRKFIEKAAGSGMFEVQVSQLAASKATDAQVKSFASMLVDHHTAANNELVKIANARGVELPAAPPRGLRKDVEKLGKKNGAEFDKEFVKEVGLEAHKKDIKLFEHASKDVKDAELKAFVDKTLPVLREHLAAAQKLPQAGKSAGAGKS